MEGYNSEVEQDPETISPQASTDQQAQIDEALAVTQGLLEMLGEAWDELAALKDELAGYREAQAAEGSVSITASEPQAPVHPIGKGILIIDGSKMLQVRIRSIVESLGYEVVAVAKDARAGLECALERNPRLVVLDYTLAAMNGLELTRKLRAERPGMRILVCSADVTWQLALEFKSLGVKDMVTKPIRLDTFIRAVKRCMGDGKRSR
jgi:CheY-like chemotaxis protein